MKFFDFDDEDEYFEEIDRNFFKVADYQEDEFVQIALDGNLSEEMGDIEREVQMELVAEELEESDETYRDAA